jgi:hypothetical protein
MILATLPSASANAQAFANVNVPGVGLVDTEVGFSTGFLGSGCVKPGDFPAGAQVSQPFTVYAIVAPRSPVNTTVRTLIRVFLPSGQVTDFGQGTVYVGPTNPSFCNSSEYTRNQNLQAGRWQWSFFFNGAEVGRLFLDVQ